MITVVFAIALVIYVAISVLIVKLIGKFTRNRVTKYVVIAVFVLIPTWDIIPGKLYFKHVCDSEAGIKVLRKVEVDRAVFLESGQLDKTKLLQRYNQTDTFDRNFSVLFHIAKASISIRDRDSGEALGAASHFYYRGGWLVNYLFPNAPSTVCPSPKESIYLRLWQEVLKPRAEGS
jgi:hypothetical protein